MHAIVKNHQKIIKKIKKMSIKKCKLKNLFSILHSSVFHKSSFKIKSKFNQIRIQVNI